MLVTANDQKLIGGFNDRATISVPEQYVSLRMLTNLASTAEHSMPLAR